MIVNDQNLFEHGPVMAGVDGSELNGAVFGRVVAGVSAMDGPGTVRWAAAEAHARHAELRLVTAGPNEVAGDDLADLTRDVAAEWPDLPVDGDVATGSPDAILRTAMADADLLVVGADDTSPFIEAMSAPGDLLTTSHCPLAVVPRQGWKARRSSAPVVVALNESTTTLAAIAYGYVAAARKGSPLTILRCVATGQRGDVVTLAQARMLVEYGELFPDVVVAAEIVADDPLPALNAISRRASLLVLGSRDRGRLASGLFGSVSRDLIRRSGCPVVIARTPPSAVVLPL